MAPFTLAAPAELADAARNHGRLEGRAFIGLPAMPGASDKAWLRAVLPDLLARHDRVVLLIESDLLCYAQGEQGVRHDKEAELLLPTGSAGVAGDRVNEDTLVRWRELEALRHSLPSDDATRMQIAAWTQFIDPTFASLWRQLLAAFAEGGAFRLDVHRLAKATLRRLGPQPEAAATARAASLCAIEALAMRLRVGEVAGYTTEYGRCQQSPLAKRLYAGAYADDGLSVRALVGHDPRRRYQRV